MRKEQSHLTWTYSWYSLLATASTAVALGLSYRYYIFPRYISSLKSIRGPPGGSFFSGHMRQILEAEAGSAQLGWVGELYHFLDYTAKGLKTDLPAFIVLQFNREIWSSVQIPGLPWKHGAIYRGSESFVPCSSAQNCEPSDLWGLKR